MDDVGKALVLEMEKDVSFGFGLLAGTGLSVVVLYFRSAADWRSRAGRSLREIRWSMVAIN